MYSAFFLQGTIPKNSSPGGHVRTGNDDCYTIKIVHRIVEMSFVIGVEKECLKYFPEFPEKSSKILVQRYKILQKRKITTTMSFICMTITIQHCKKRRKHNNYSNLVVRIHVDKARFRQSDGRHGHEWCNIRYYPKVHVPQGNYLLRSLSEAAILFLTWPGLYNL